MSNFEQYDLYADTKYREDRLNSDFKIYCKNEGIDLEYFKYLLTLVTGK
ncbi:hypothetical protein J1C67_15525 [Clostridium gasigenes]|nr:hypothetical protein [Clostridium gasigenes]NKF05491.1 hypothetical protein [Clostridium gasigenes]QSW18936.1 hypothetical protein J1C67_15525 [Clostridium gasigenes]